MHRLRHHFTGKVRGEQFDEVLRIAAQVFVLADRDVRGAGLEQVGCIHHPQQIKGPGSD